jgi:hypothetical protein
MEKFFERGDTVRIAKSNYSSGDRNLHIGKEGVILDISQAGFLIYGSGWWWHPDELEFVSSRHHCCHCLGR